MITLTGSVEMTKTGNADGNGPAVAGWASINGLVDNLAIGMGNVRIAWNSLLVIMVNDGSGTTMLVERDDTLSANIHALLAEMADEIAMEVEVATMSTVTMIMMIMMIIMIYMTILINSKNYLTPTTMRLTMKA